MTYEELVQSVKDIYANADAGNVKEHVAIQCNIEGEAEGALYIEFSEGNIDVQPYEYYDRDAILTLSAANLLEIAAGKKEEECVQLEMHFEEPAETKAEEKVEEKKEEKAGGRRKRAARKAAMRKASHNKK